MANTCTYAYVIFDCNVAVNIGTHLSRPSQSAADTCPCISTLLLSLSTARELEYSLFATLINEADILYAISSS